MLSTLLKAPFECNTLRCMASLISGNGNILSSILPTTTTTTTIPPAVMSVCYWFIL